MLRSKIPRWGRIFIGTMGFNMHRAEIRIEGRLDEKWAEWFEDFELTYTETGDTVLSGVVLDQAALYGLIAKLRDLGVRLKGVDFDSTAQDDVE